jgi:phosphatidylethanolamine-binding protein (PEBP) family uncharacterized protein
MKITPFLLVGSLVFGSLTLSVRAHIIGDEAHDGKPPVYNLNVIPPMAIMLSGAQLKADTVLLAQSPAPASSAVATKKPANIMATPFQAFAPKVKTRTDDRFLYVESDGMPAHNMMVGITAWQQQVPLPQAYTGNNAWRIPLQPVPAKEPASIKGRFLRGAVALAVNGIPIFNPQNNRGEVSQEIGELDQWGGHCGRADDYHYHAAPFHLQTVVGKGQPIAYALDGYPIYGLTEPDGSAPVKLDAFNGHEVAGLGYHYHGSTKYPYVNGGFHGEVVEREGQVDPQPRAQTVREAGTPLRGAKITGFTVKDKSYSLKYEVNGSTRFVNYVLNDNGTVKFDFVDGSGQVKSETYSPRQGGGGGGRPPGDQKGKEGQKRGPGKGPQRPDGERPPGDRAEAPGMREQDGGAPAVIFKPKRSGNFTLHSPAVMADGLLPTEFTGDGSGSTLPLEWKGAPAGTKGYALIMDHLAPGNVMKSYWTMWDIPVSVTSLPKNVKGVGKLGTSFKGDIGYEPPHSQGPGAKTYVLTVYALATPLQINRPANEVTRELLLTTMKDSVLDSAELKVTYTRPAGMGNGETKGGPGKRKGGKEQ